MAEYPIVSKTLDENGRCCGRKPLVYKQPVHRLFCCRCDAEFTPSGEQVPNWAWTAVDGGFQASERIQAADKAMGRV